MPDVEPPTTNSQFEVSLTYIIGVGRFRLLGGGGGGGGGKV